MLFTLYSLPNFWVATMATVYLGGGDFWSVFPVAGLHTTGSESWSKWDQFVDQIWHLILPVACFTYYVFAVLSRYSSLAEKGWPLALHDGEFVVTLVGSETLSPAVPIDTECWIWQLSGETKINGVCVLEGNTLLVPSVVSWQKGEGVSRALLIYSTANFL